MATITGPRPVRAARGSEISCKGWQQEAALRMLMNNLDPEVAEHPDDLVVYGGTGRAARSWEAFDAIVRTLRSLEDDETMLVQSGKPVGVFRTNVWAPRVLLANSNLVGDWANWEEFRKLEAEGLMMYGQMTAGSWIYIGTQGILQGTFETFGAVARKRFGGTLAGTITLTAGVGGMGGAQPLAVTMNEGVAICVDCDESRIDRRIAHRYLDTKADSLDDALKMAIDARDAKRPLSIGLVGNAAEVYPELLEREAPIDIVTDQTSAHDPLSYLPLGIEFEDMKKMAEKDAVYFTEQAQLSMAKQVKAMVGFMDRGAEVFDYGNSIRDEARKAGYDRAFAFPGFVPAYIRPQFEEGLGPFRWAALSGDPKDIAATDRAILELFPENAHLRRWITMAGEKVAFEGLPARICWLGYGERHRAGLKFNEMVASGELSAPIVIGRDHLDSGSVASPYRETESMLDGSDAIADWPLLNALLNTASGASWVSIHHGGGVGMGRSIHAGQVCVADGTDLAAQKLRASSSTTPAWASSGTSTPDTSTPQRWPPSGESGFPCRRTYDGVRHTVADHPRGRAKRRNRRISPVRMVRRRPDAARMVHRVRRKPWDGRRSRSQRQHVGVVDAARMDRRPTRRLRDRLTPRLGPGRRRLRRPAGSGVGVLGDRHRARTRRGADHSRCGGGLFGRGRGEVRSRLRRIAAVDRRLERRPGTRTT